MNKRAKGEQLALSLLAYIQAHPEQRFWQALCNWAGVGKLYVQPLDFIEGRTDKEYHLQDVFYWERING